MHTLTRTFVTLLVVLLPSSIAAGAGKPNPHNTDDCLFCHGAEPRFGVDTRDTVTFRDLAPDDPALCLRCHKPEENLHPLGVKPGEAAGTRAPDGLALGAAAGREWTVVCTTCHFVHAASAEWALLRGFPGSQDPGRFKAWQDLCRACHGEGLERRSPHAGDDRACAFCHQAKPVAGKAVSVLPRGDALCNFCHGGLQNGHYRGADPFGGQPACSRCHDPHLGPDHPARLRSSYLEAAVKKATVNPHNRRTLCAACHLEGKDYQLLDADPVALCNRCHGTGEIPGDPHPLAAVPAEVKVPADWPLRGSSLTCSTCHRPGHREDGPSYKLLRGGPYADRNDVCFVCHNREAFARRNPHLDINEGKGCGFCHAVPPVPGRDNHRTVKLLADAAILCLRCHAESPHPASFNHTIGVEPERAAGISELPIFDNNRITCATCHNPHVAEIEDHKLRGGMGVMGICTFCHRL